MSEPNSTPTPATLLRDFRRHCERSAGQPAIALELPLLTVLVDVCAALELSAADTARVLGRQGVRDLRAMRDTQVTP